MTTRTYSGLRFLATLEERFEYLSLKGTVGAETFGHERYINQKFYRSSEWQRIRQQVIVRDDGCDLGVPGYDIEERIIIHHIQPMTARDIKLGNRLVLDPDNLICTTHDTHNAIHYGDKSLLPRELVERRPGDTLPWRKLQGVPHDTPNNR